MNSSILRKANLLSLLFFAAFFAQAQQPAMKLKLQLISPNKWGVYVKPELPITTGQTITIGGDQVTVVMPLNYPILNFTSVHGNWSLNAVVHGPSENPTASYYSPGFQSEAPPIPYQNGVETLLFTFQGDVTCPDSMYLINNADDPFSTSPNSLNSNPQNEFAVFDMVTGQAYSYGGNYAPAAWSCKDNDGDGILNALEDTNGNGIYDPGIDASDLNLACELAFTLDPKDATVCSGNDTTFTVTASIPQGTFSFGWQISDDNGLSWLDIDFTTMAALFSHSISGEVAAGTDTLTVKNVASMYGRRFRAVAHPQGCIDVYSNYAVLSLEGPLTVNTNPVSVVECSGNPTTFSGSFNNPGIPGSTIYRWQVSSDGGVTWSDLPNMIPYNGTGTTTLSITNVAGLHGKYYRLSARTSTCNMVYSAPALLTVEGPITVTLQPQTVDLCAGQPASFTSTAHAGTSGTLSYQWQVSIDNNVTWTNVEANTYGDVYTGINSTTLTTLNLSNTTGLYSRSYRLAFSTAECGQVYSDAAGMNIDGPIAISAHPKDVIQCSGEAVLFGAKAASYSLETNNSGLIQHQWQESTGDTINDWKDLYPDTLYNGTNTDTLSISYTTNLDGNYYRMKIWTDNCSDTVYSYAALLDVEGPITVTQQPSSITECAGNGATFHSTVSFQNGNPATLIYQWEVSQYNAGTGIYGAYTNVFDSGIYSGATTNTLNISDVAGMDKWRFRMRFRTPNCSNQYSNYATLTVEGPIGFAVGGHPDDVVECSGNPAIFKVITTYSSAAAIQYQWEILVDPLAYTTDAYNWIPLLNNSIYNGTKTANLSISNVADLNGFRFRARIRTSTCSTLFSHTALMTVEGPLYFTEQPDDITQCPGESATFSGAAAIAAGNSGTITYQWQWSDNATCTNYSNISATTAPQNNISGYNTLTLTIGNVTGLNGRCIRLAAKTGECNNIYTFPAKLTVGPAISVLTQPQDLNTCGSNPIQFQATFSNTGSSPINYQWERRNSANDPWELIVDDSIYEGSATNLLTIHSDYPINGHQFRLHYSSSICNNSWTDEATLEYEPICVSACIRLKLQLLPDSSGWAVIAKPQNGYVPTGNNSLTAGKITIVTPADFTLSGLENGLGQWDLTNVVTSPAGHPGRRYQTLDLMPNGSNLALNAGETKLFQFDKPGACPDSMYILEGTVAGVSPNQFVGQDASFTGGFEYCGVYARKAWRCFGPDLPGGPIFDTGAEDFTGSSQAGANKLGNSFPEGKKPKIQDAQAFTLAPNPASDFVNILVSANLAEGRSTISLWDLQGKKRQEFLVENTALNLDLSGLPAGVYFVSLTQNGHIQERKKLIKN